MKNYQNKNNYVNIYIKLKIMMFIKDSHLD